MKKDKNRLREFNVSKFAKDFADQFDECDCGEAKDKDNKECLYCQRLKHHPRYGKEIIFR